MSETLLASRPDTREDATDALNSPEAEQALLGAVLLDNEVLNEVGGVVRAEHFHNPVHTRIWQSSVDMIGAGRMVSAITLKARFRTDPDLRDTEASVEYFAMLLQVAAGRRAAMEYAKLIRSMATRRELVRVGRDVAHRALDTLSDDKVSTIVEEAESELHALGETGAARRTTFTVGEAVLDVIASANAAKDRGGIAGLPTGLRELDAILRGLAPGDLCVLAGRPAMGKSALAATIARNLARSYAPPAEERDQLQQGGRVALFSLEMSAEQISRRLLAMQADVPSDAIRAGDMSSSQFHALTNAAVAINSWPLAIDETAAITLSGLSRIARRQQRLHGLDLVVVDYLQLMSPPPHTRSQGRVVEVSAISAGLKQLAKDLGVPVLALAQLSRAVEQRDNKRPILSDLRESGSIEQDADVVMFAYRDEYYLRKQEPEPGSDAWNAWRDAMAKAKGRAEIIVEKNRHGSIGTAHVQFRAHRTEFTNWMEKAA